MKRLLLGIVLLAAACSDPAGPDSVTLELGELSVLGADLRIEVPATVTAGEPFEVIVYTYGSGCYSLGRTLVDVGVREAVIRPFDWVEHWDSGLCFMSLGHFRHVAEITFALPGTGAILVNGVSRPAFGTVDTVWVEREVEVLP